MANNVDVKDAGGNTVTFKTTDTAGVHRGHIEVDASALPTGAATSAAQATSNTALGAPADAAATGDGSIIGILKQLRVLLGGTLAVGGTVTANTGLSQPLTDTELRATAVPVSGPLTDAQLRATAVPVSVSGVATEAKQDSLITNVGGTADAAATGDGSVIAILKQLRVLFGASAAAAEGVANPTSGFLKSALMVFNGTTWDRWRSQASNADALTAGAVGSGNEAMARVAALGYMYNGSTFDRIRGDTTNGLLVNLSGNALTALQLIDDAIYVDDADWTDGTSKHVLVGGLYQSVQQTVTDGDVGPFQIDENGNLKVNIVAGAAAGGTSSNFAAAFPSAGTAMGMYDGSANMIAVPGTAAGGLLVDLGANNDVVVSGTVDLGATDNGVLDSIAALLSTIDADTGAIAVDAAAMEVLLGTIDVDTGNIASGVGGTADAAATAGSTGSLNAKLRLMTTQLSLLYANSNVAHDAADAGNPIKMGGRARSTDITAVASNDRVDMLTDLLGKLVVLPYSIPENSVRGVISTAITDTTSTSLLAAPGAGRRNYVTTLVISNSHATVGTDVLVQDGSGGTTLMVIPAAAIYGGAVINLPVPLRQPTANTALFIAPVTTGAAIKATAIGFSGV